MLPLAAFTYAIHLFLAIVLQNITTLVSTEEGTKPKGGWSAPDDPISKWQDQGQSWPAFYEVLLFRQWKQDTKMIRCRLSVHISLFSLLFTPLIYFVLFNYICQLSPAIAAVCWTLIAPHRTWTHMVNFLPQLLCILGCNCSLQNLSPHAQFPYQLSSPHCLQGTMANAAHRGICTCDYCHFPLELSQEKHYSRVPFK